MGGDWSKESFREGLARNLKDGRFRLVIVVDKVNDELRRTVEYLNACTAPGFQFLCAELRYFVTERRTELLIPALIGKPSVSKPVSTRSRWNAETFFAKLREDQGEQIREVAQRLLDWCQNKVHCDDVQWGTGPQRGSFMAYARSYDGHMVNMFGVMTDGVISINFGYARPYPPFDGEDKRREWQSRILKNGLKLSNNSVDGYPGLPVKSLSDPGKCQAFLDAMQWAFDQVRSPST